MALRPRLRAPRAERGAPGSDLAATVVYGRDHAALGPSPDLRSVHRRIRVRSGAGFALGPSPDSRRSVAGFALAPAADDPTPFRELGSRAPGHPEYHHTAGGEVTTGPLGQGFANAVGLAIAEAHLAAVYNREQTIVDHFTYALAGDGDLMEGVS